MYHESEHGIGWLEAVGTLFPEIAVPLDSGDVSADSISCLRHDEIWGCIIGTLSRQSVGNAEPTDTGADDYAIEHTTCPTVVFGGTRLVRGGNCGGLLRD